MYSYNSPPEIWIWCIFITVHFKTLLITFVISVLTCGSFRRMLFNICLFEAFAFANWFFQFNSTVFREYAF